MSADFFEEMRVGDDLDLSFDFSEWLPTGDTISSATWTISPASGLTLDNASATSKVATPYAAASAAGKYRVRCEILTTPDSRECIREKLVWVRT